MGVGRRTMGVDASLTRTGLVVLEQRKGRVKRVAWRQATTSPQDGELEDRIEFITQKVLKLWRKYEPDVVCMEGGARGGRVVDLSIYHLAGVIRQDLWREEALVIMKPPTTLKAHMGNGRYNKDQMLAAVRAHWPECPNHDVGDAWAAADYGLTHYDELIFPSA